MQLSYRRTTPEDFPACLEMTRENFALDAAQRAGLCELWRHILANSLGETAIVEQHEEGKAGRRRRPVAFGLSAFVTDAFMADLQNGAPPFVATYALARWRAGDSPLLHPDEIARANRSDGLNLLVLNSGQDPRMAEGSALMHAAQRTSIGSFFAVHAGYRIKEMLAEFCGEKVLEDALAGGLKLRTDHADYYAQSGAAPPPPNQRPYLTGLTRREATESPGLGFATLFLFNEPRFEFTDTERRLLWRALDGETDDDLARGLSLSSSTVKKRWQAIYGRVARLAPDLLPEGSDEGRAGSRGSERRRHLLNYLRDHREELRPR